MAASSSPLVKAVMHLEAADWQAAHAIAQKDSSALGCWAHGIVHLMEGDLGNAQYWYRRAHRTLPGAERGGAEIAALRHALELELHTSTLINPIDPSI